MMLTMQSRNTQDTVIPLAGFGLVTVLLPLVTFHITYLVSASQGHVEWCVPYWDACTSISATGHHGAGYFIFKGAMIPGITLQVIFWAINHQWLKSLGYPRGKGVGWLGFAAGVCFLPYVLSLGHVGEGFELARRIGTVGNVGLTGIVQILLGAVLWRSPYPLLMRGGRRLLMLSGFTLGVAMLSLILQSIPAVDWDSIKYAFDWNLIILINLHGVGIVLLWWKSGLAVTLPRTMNLE
jgi:hypothetical protein